MKNNLLNYGPIAAIDLSFPIVLMKGAVSANLLRCLKTHCLRLVLQRHAPDFSIDTLFLYDIKEYRRGYRY